MKNKKANPNGILAAFHKDVEKLRAQHGIPYMRLTTAILVPDKKVEKSCSIEHVSTYGEHPVVTRQVLTVNEIRRLRQAQCGAFHASET